MVRERASAYLPWLVVSNWNNGPDSLRIDHLNHNGSRQFSGSKESISSISFHRIQFVQENSSKLTKSNQFEKQIAETPAKTKMAKKTYTKFPFLQMENKMVIRALTLSQICYYFVALPFRTWHSPLWFHYQNKQSRKYSVKCIQPQRAWTKTKPTENWKNFGTNEHIREKLNRNEYAPGVLQRLLFAYTRLLVHVSCFFSLLFSFSLPHSFLAFSDRLLKPNIHTIKYLFNADFSLVSMRPHTAKIRSNTSKCLCCSPKTLSFQQFKNSFVSL